MATHGPKFVAPAGPSKSIFQPHPATVAPVPAPSTPTTTSAPSGKAAPPNGGKPV